MFERAMRTAVMAVTLAAMTFNGGNLFGGTDSTARVVEPADDADAVFKRFSDMALDDFKALDPQEQWKLAKSFVDKVSLAMPDKEGAALIRNNFKHLLMPGLAALEGGITATERSAKRDDFDLHRISIAKVLRSVLELMYTDPQFLISPGTSQKGTGTAVEK